MFIKRSVLTWLIIAVVGVGAVGGSLYLGYRLGQQDPKVVTVKGVTNVDDPDVRADFGLFWQVWEKLKEYHIKGGEIPDKDLVYGSVHGLVGAMNDPHTIFLPPSDAKKFEEDVKGNFGGIGAEIGVRDDQLLVIAPLKDSPAEKSGLMSKDKILAVNGESTQGINANEAVKKIRGEIGTEVVLTILRNGWEEAKEFKIIRDEIQVPTIDWDVKEGNILHVKFYAFNENAPALFYRAVVDGLARGAEGLVLDMRNNPGGFLEVAVNIAGWFLKKGAPVITEDFRVGQDTVFEARGNEALKDFPTVVLVNGGSASASEIVAGALRDHRGIKIIGETTFGKGTVQELQNLKDGSSLKITVAKWVMPAGGVIEDEGLKPDVEVKLSKEDLESGNDAQLSKAFEILKAEIK